MESRALDTTGRGFLIYCHTDTQHAFSSFGILSAQPMCVPCSLPRLPHAPAPCFSPSRAASQEFAKKKDASDVQLPCSMGLAPVFRPSSQNVCILLLEMSSSMLCASHISLYVQTLGLESVLLGSETQSGDPSEEPRTPSPPVKLSVSSSPSWSLVLWQNATH